jgi:hypothetical protein
LNVAVSNQDLEVRDKDGRAKRRKGESIKLSDVITAPAQSTFFSSKPSAIGCHPPQGKATKH